MERTSIAGKRFGRMVVIKLHHKVGYNFYYECRCDCGKIFISNKSDIARGHVNSCGCLRRELKHLRDFKHGMANTRPYKIWNGLKGRCYNNNDKDYHNYGGRGITVCDEWIDKENDFMSFYNWSMEN